MFQELCLGSVYMLPYFFYSATHTMDYWAIFHEGNEVQKG